MTPELEVPEFTSNDIDDVRVIFNVKGKNYSIIPKDDREEAKMIRIAIGSILLQTHYVVTPSLEEIKERKTK